MSVRVKFCGITNPDDAVTAAELGVDSIGLVFSKASPRVIDISKAAVIESATPAFVTLTGLFMNQEAESVRAVLRNVRIDLLQFHGDESAEFCRSFGRRYIKAIAMGDGVDPAALAQSYPDACALLFDSHLSGQPGGTGTAFDWRSLPRGVIRPVILAGGLAPDNVRQAIEQVRPYGVDVSSGIESAPGIKNSDKMQAFMKEVKYAG